MRYILYFIFFLGVFTVHAQTAQDSVKIPNVFTPNQDGVNDVFKPDLNFENKSQNYSIEVYNRFGVSVFSASKPNQHWDGRTTSGIACPEGTYFYILQLTINSAKLEYKGFVQLFR